MRITVDDLPDKMAVKTLWRTRPPCLAAHSLDLTKQTSLPTGVSLRSFECFKGAYAQRNALLLESIVRKGRIIGDLKKKKNTNRELRGGKTVIGRLIGCGRMRSMMPSPENWTR